MTSPKVRVVAWDMLGSRVGTQHSPEAMSNLSKKLSFLFLCNDFELFFPYYFSECYNSWQF